MGKFEKLLEPLKLNERYTMRNRVVSAPMAFTLVAKIPETGEKSFRKLEAPARGGDAIVCVGELDVNFKDAIRVPFPPVDFANPDDYTLERVSEYPKRIHKHGAIALQEVMHGGKEKIPFSPEEESIGPNNEVHDNGTHVRAMTEDDMARIIGDFVTVSKFAEKCGYDGVVVHGGHGFLFSQFLSSVINKRTDQYGGSFENRARYPLAILKAIREAMGPEFLIELRISGEDGFGNGGITPEETGQFLHLCEGIIDLAHISTGHYYDPVITGQFPSMFIPHGDNRRLAKVVKQYTSLPIGVVGGINSPELAEEILEKGEADYIVLGRQSLSDPEFVNKAKAGEEAYIRRCMRCFKCFPGSPEEKYKDIPIPNTELAQVVGQCAINPLSTLTFDPYEMADAAERKRVLIVGGGPAGLQAAITASERGHEVILCEKAGKLGGLLYFADVDIDKPDVKSFKDAMVADVLRRDIEVRLNTEVTPELIREVAPGHVILATGSLPAQAPIPGIENAVQALAVYDGSCVPGKKVVVIGGGLVGAEEALFLAKTGHEVTVVEMLPRIASESFGMYREALLLELDKEKVSLLTDTKCLGIEPGAARVQGPDGAEQVLAADTILYALGMKPAPMEGLAAAAEAAGIPVTLVGDALGAAKLDQATRTAYLAAIGIA
ncbi:MAG: FAD-dependent oxidoreductase [Clostridiales Family XIII bacterium]|jgi:2,4-dienoyl-CoA reductase-like NADH-dependent reductase (Old Yellow Enzyme family)/thioredoxin reductase|nr:FAD-dependent oxidoreductase [Clostridiales Family XIII bacterium]